MVHNRVPQMYIFWTNIPAHIAPKAIAITKAICRMEVRKFVIRIIAAIILNRASLLYIRFQS